MASSLSGPRVPSASPIDKILPPAPGQAAPADSLGSVIRKAGDASLAAAAVRLPPVADKLKQSSQFYAATESDKFERVLITRSFDGKKDQLYNIVRTPEGLDDVYLTDRFVDHVIYHHTDHREQFANYVLPTLQDPLEVYLQAVTLDNGKVTYRQMFIKHFTDKKTVMIVQEDAKYGALAWSFVPLNRFSKKHRTGKLIYRREGSHEGK